MIMTRIKTGVICALALGALAACGNQPVSERQGGEIFSAVRQVAGQALPGKDKDKKPAAPKSPTEMAAEALRVNPGPLILVGLEKPAAKNQVMAMTGQNGAMRTYMTPNEQAIILRNGLLVGTRGLGNDLSVAEPQTEALIHAGRSGPGQRVMRYYTGDGVETPLSFDCTTGPGPKPGVVVEDCSGHGTKFQNSYISQGGQIQVSRQWVGPALGYITVQVLRP